MARHMTQRVLDEAIKRTPGTVAKMSRGQLTKRERKAFSVYTVSKLMEEFRDPRAVLLEIASMDTAALAQLAQCSMLDALQERRLCAQAVLPYVAQKLPVQVDMRHSKAIHLNIVDDHTYNELQAVAQGDAEASDTHNGMSLQLMTGTAAESEDQQDDMQLNDIPAGGGKGVLPSMPRASPQEAVTSERDWWQRSDGASHRIRASDVAHA